jgi:tetratricopeptide (TPR) repeat protein
MLQDYERGAWYFRSVQELFQKAVAGGGWQRWLGRQGIYQEAWIEQNLALAYEWQGRLDKAEPHWNRYFDYLEQYQRHSQPPDYLTALAFEGLSRLADVYTKKEKWSPALGCLQRAHRLRPGDSDTLDRLFQLYSQLKRFDEARRLLRSLRESRPNDPQVEIFELEVRDVRNIDDLDRLVVDIRRALQRFQHDPRVEDRAGAVVNNLVPMLERFADQFTGQVNKVVDQMRRLPSYQINWPMVRDVMRDMEDRFLFLRRIAQRVLTLLTNDDLRRDVNSLLHHCDRKIDQCHSLGD